MFKYLTMYIVDRGRGMLAVLALAALITTSALLALPVSDLVWARDESVCSLRITEIRPNAFVSEGEWFEVTNFGDISCTIVGGTSGGSSSAWRFSEKRSTGIVDRHLLPFDNGGPFGDDVTLDPDETVIFAASPVGFINTWFPSGVPCEVRNITSNPGFNNDKDEVIVRDSPNEGDDDIDTLQYDFEGGVSKDRSVALLDVDGDGDGDPVQSLPTPCFPVACVPLFGILGDAECNIIVPE